MKKRELQELNTLEEKAIKKFVEKFNWNRVINCLSNKERARYGELMSKLDENFKR